MKKSYLLAASSFAVLSFVLPPASPVWAAQAQSASAAEPLDEIVVSASRINISGYEQPTPVTVVDTASLERDAQTNLGGIFRALPSFGTASSPDTNQGAQGVSGGGAGSENIALRNLTAGRTLVLVNRNRVVGTDIGATSVDLNMIPSMLIQRVDIVTGGASAAWGSDAVAGVVNFIMNDKFDGLQFSIDGANNWLLNKVTGKTQLAYGTSFNDGRGHYILGLSYLNSPLTPLTSQMNWRKPGDYIALVNNPAYTPTNGLPQLITAHNVRYSTKTSGGLINAGPLKGIQFVGPNGTPIPFNFGNISGNFCTNCDGQDPIEAGQNDLLSVPIDTQALYNRFTYEFTDSLRSHLEINVTRLHAQNSSITNQRDIAIKADNAFMDPTIAARMAALNLATFTLGTTLQNNLPKGANPNTDTRNQIGNYQARFTRIMYRAVFGLEGDIGENWRWNADFQYSRAKRDSIQFNGTYVANLNRAVDAVRVTAANVGTSGLQPGTIVCRSTLTTPTNRCKPLNLFGDGVFSQEAIDYVNPPPGHPEAQVSDLKQTQLTGSLSVSGKLFELPAGDVATAAGLDFREEHSHQTANALAYAVAYSTGNFQPFYRGEISREAFAEVEVPLLKDQGVRSLSVNSAARLTDYQSSGKVVTWKVGAVSQLTDDIRLRGTASRDIRAPSLVQLYTLGQFAAGLIVPGQSALASNFTGGNPDLKPEKAKQWTVGAVLTPQFLPGLSISADWYDILIKGVFFTPNGVQLVQQCNLGVQVYCNQIIRDASGTITVYRAIPVNAAQQTTKGADFQADYRFDAFNGELTLGVLASYLHEQKLTSAVGILNTAGSINLDPGGAGPPKLRSTAKLTYTQGPFSGTIQTRFSGTAHVNNIYHEGGGPNSIDNNKVPMVAYLDLRGSYNFGPDENWQLYAAVDNLLDVAPALAPATATQTFPGFYPPTSLNFYDGLGVSFRYGLRIKF